MMAITLSNVTLRDGLMWVDRYGAQSVSQNMLRTLGGLPVFYYAKLQSGVLVSLESLDDQGWQTKETVDALYALASVAGAQYVLNLGPEQFTVMFRHHEPPAFEATPLIPRPTPLAGDYFTVKMKLITI